MTDKISSIRIIKLVPKSETAPYGCVNVNTVPIDIPVMVAVGGELTTTDKDANFYAKQLQKLFKEADVTGIDIYSIAYNFGEIKSSLERAEAFRKASRRLNEKALKPELETFIKDVRSKEPVSNYIKQIFNIFLAPRIINTSGERLDITTAINNLRKIKFYAHCHGASALWQTANYMRETMRTIGYSPDEISKIQKEVLVIQHSPLAPLNNKNFTTISFASAEDTMMLEHNNLFSDWIYENSQDVVPCFFDKKRGNIFIAGHLQNTVFKEHDSKGFLLSEKESSTLTSDGKIIFGAERNALINSAKAAVSGKPTTSIKKLTNGNGIDFDQLKQNGDFIYRVMLNDLRQQNLKHDHQK